MSPEKPTLGIYGIQDRAETDEPQLVHDHGLALINSGKVENYLHLERITREPNDNTLYKNLPLLATEANWENADFDVVFVDNFIGRAFISSNGQIRFEAPLINRLTKDWEESRLFWFKKDLKSYVLNHELAHVFSSLPFYGTFKENSLLIHFDGGASFSNFSAWMYRMGKIIPVEHHWELKYLTNLYSTNALTRFILDVKSKDQKNVSDKLMGFAALGNYNEDIEFWLRKNKWFEDILGKPSIFFEKAKIDFNIDLKSFDQRNTFLQDIIATIQDVFMRDTLMKFDDLNSLSNCKNLYYTGGCAYNFNTNSALVESNLFENIYIPPCPNDSGLALGAAAFGEWKKGNNIQTHTAFLNNWGLNQIDIEYTNTDISLAAQLLAEGKVLATCNGDGEVGKLSLGNRSLLALPTKALAQKVSVELKKREWYQPVTPVMLEKNTSYFTGSKTVNHLSKFMLLDLKILPEKQSEIQGVVHSNGTACVQTIFSPTDNPFLFDLLTILDNQYGIKALINAPFNIQGEPLVHTIDDAIRSANTMGFDAVILNGKVNLINV